MTTALDIIRLVYAHSGKLSIEGDTLKISTPAPLPDDLRQAVREHKPAIMVALGAPLDMLVSSILADIRPYLPEALQRLTDDHLLALVNWSVMAAWERAIHSFEEGASRGRTKAQE